jgi:hypothetical protein
MAIVDPSDFRREIESTITIGKANVIRSKDKKRSKKTDDSSPHFHPSLWGVDLASELLGRNFKIYIGKSGRGGLGTKNCSDPTFLFENYDKFTTYRDEKVEGDYENKKGTLTIFAGWDGAFR